MDEVQEGMNTGITLADVQTRMAIEQVQGFPDLIVYRKQLMREQTPKSQIRMKDKFPYLPSKYVDDTFSRWFPVHNVKMIDRAEDAFSITYTVEITVGFPGGVVISKIGTGGSSKKLKTSARDKIEGNPEKGIVADPTYKPTPYDYVNLGNDSKAALTLAIKNCQERFGVGADITERAILSEEEIKEINETIDKVLASITGIKDRIEWKNKVGACDTPNKKLRLLEEMREVFDVESIIMEASNGS